MSKQITVEEIEFYFDTDKTNPEKFFSNVQNFFAGLYTLQNEVISKCEPAYKVEYAIREINAASLLTKVIRTIIKPDETEGELPLSDDTGNIEEYCNKVQDSVLNKFVQKKDDVIENSDMVELSKRILDVANETGVSKKRNFKQPNIITLLDSVKTLQKVANGMGQNFNYTYNRNDTKIDIPRFYVDVDAERLIDETQSKEVKTNFSKNLKIKQVDFLGNSKWHFKFDDIRTIEAKILDEDWIEKFHSGNMKIASGNFLKVDGFIKDKRDDSGNIISTEYFITKVYDISESANE